MPGVPSSISDDFDDIVELPLLEQATETAHRSDRHLDSLTFVDYMNRHHCKFFVTFFVSVLPF